MSYIFVGLGNPGEEYENTRHNVGKMMLSWFAEDKKTSFVYDKKINAQVAKTKIGKSPVTLVLPDTFMNNSGKALKDLVNNPKKAEKLVVIYDDLDLPFDKEKVSHNRSSGGHRGLESIIKSIKTKNFTRIRIGISPKTPTGKIKKPTGEEKVMKFILGKFSPDEIKVLKKKSKKVSEALVNLVEFGLEKTMTEFN
ncbi:MAG: aminoacyl-tRNA hydrolase [Candidatus Paceibacterota bacterium]